MRHIVYHVGLLAADRQLNPKLDSLAEHYLQRGTPGHRLVRAAPMVMPLDDLERLPVGTGRGYLTQKRLRPGVYEYRFTPARA